MTQILKGAPAANALYEKTEKISESLAEAGIHPSLAIIRVGENPDDISYENSACRQAGKAGVTVLRFTLPDTADERQLADTICMANDDENIHGILLLRPLPRRFDEERIVSLVNPAKDVDGITQTSLTGIFMGRKQGFAPCTAAACMEMLDYYGIDCTGLHAVVIGRSLVVGRPVSILLLHRNATVTICHTRTRNLTEEVRRGDLIIAAAGRQGIVGREQLREGQIVLDVGIHVDENGRMHGDVVTEEADGLVQAITPVPGGIGSLTTAVLMSHVVEAAAAQSGRSDSVQGA